MDEINQFEGITKEICISTLRTKINLIPVFGSIINEFLFDLPGRIAQNRVNSFVEELGKRIEKIENQKKVHLDLKSEEFFDLTKTVFEVSASLNSEDKRRFLANLYLDSIYSFQSNLDLQAVFCGFIKSLTQGQIFILKFINGNEDTLKEIGSYEKYFEVFKSLSGILIDKYEFKFYTADLEAKSLISTGAGLTNFDDHSMIRVVEEHREASIKLTTLGKKFISYLVS